MKKWAKISTLVGSGVLLAGAGAGTVAAIVVPKALKAKEALETVFNVGGPNNALRWGNKKLNYIALGDSETAGYNMRLKKDYLSYADFLANDLKQAGRLGTYKNFAVSGAKIPDLELLFSQKTSAQKAFENADLITITIGANDLLSFVEMFRLPFSVAASGFNGLREGVVTADNAARNALGLNTSGMQTNWGPVDTKVQEKVVEDATRILKHIADTGDYNQTLNINEKIKPKVFDLIKRNFALFIRDLHHLAPNAQIMVLGHAFPFQQWAKSAVDTPRPDFWNMTVRGIYDKFLNSMKEGLEVTVDHKDAKYVEFIKLDNLRITKSSRGTMPANGIYTDYIKHAEQDPVTHRWTRPAGFNELNAMPLAGDIHPSTFGHELLGNGLFNNIGGRYLHLNQSDIEKHFTLSKPFTNDNIVQPFERLDESEDNNKSTTEDMMFDLFHHQGALINFLQSMNGIDPTGFFKGLFLKPSMAGMISKMFGNPLYRIPTPGAHTSGDAHSAHKRAGFTLPAGSLNALTELLTEIFKNIENPFIKSFLNSTIFREQVGIFDLLKLDGDKTPAFKPTDGHAHISELFDGVDSNASYDPNNAKHKGISDWQARMNNTVLTDEYVTAAKAFITKMFDMELTHQSLPASKAVVPGTPTPNPLTTYSSANITAYINDLKLAIFNDLDSTLAKVKTATTKEEKQYWTAWAGKHIYTVTTENNTKVDWAHDFIENRFTNIIIDIHAIAAGASPR